MVSLRFPNLLHSSILGDSFFAVFDDLDDALSLAVRLEGLLFEGNWEELGLSDGLQVRISMHAGPVYEEMDPITDEKKFLRETRQSSCSHRTDRLARIRLRFGNHGGPTILRTQ